MNTRIAPSPTGKAHIGFVRTAYINYLAAKSTGGKFILRIDDTDKSRNSNEYIDDLKSTLAWLGLDYDLCFNQSSRFNRYQNVAKVLINNGDAIEKDGAVLFTPQNIATSWMDSIVGEIKIKDDKLQSINNLVLLRSDGSPTYHFASVIDDNDYDIDWVIRGVDHIDNTAKHVNIYNALNQELPKFSHIGLIFHNGKKISKRDGVASMDAYKTYNPQAILNAVLKLGWSHTNANIDKLYPIINKETAVQLFPQGNLRNQNCSLDLNKLEWLNKKFESLKK